jgi:hypothetical protein
MAAFHKVHPDISLGVTPALDKAFIWWASLSHREQIELAKTYLNTSQVTNEWWMVMFIYSKVHPD